MIDARELYQELILDHNRSPKNFRVIEVPTAESEGYNPLCGDRYTVYVELDGDRITDVDGVAAGAGKVFLLTDNANANAGENQCLIWEAFARRGVGFSATSELSSTTTVTEAFDEPVACQNECGNSTLQSGEQCDDGGTAFFDGCASNCHSETLLPAFSGSAAGGTVTATIDGVAVQITTTSGQTAADVATALAAAINASTALQALFDIAASQTNQVVVTGNLDSLVIADAGLNPTSVPALGTSGRALLALGLILSAAGVSRSVGVGRFPSAVDRA